MGAPKLPPYSDLAQMTAQGLRQEDIAERFGVRPASVGAALRKGQGAEKSKSRPAPVSAKVPLVAPDAFVASRLATDRIAALVATGGRYRELTDLAQRWGEPILRVQGWWHRLRVAS